MALSELSPAQRQGAIVSAVEALNDGGIVLATCESAMLLCARADVFAGIETLRAALKGMSAGNTPSPAFPVWLLPGVGRALAALPALASQSRRLLERLAPGPAVFVIDVDPDALDHARSVSRAGMEAIDDGASLAIRVPAPSPAEMLALKGIGAIACIEVLDERGVPIFDLSAALARTKAVGVDLAAVLHDGSIAHRHPATVLHLGPGRPPTVVRAGAYEERFVHKQLTTTMLFVCTGNTCRSPMALAIAQGLVSQQGLVSKSGALALGGAGPSVRVDSAGVAAGHGAGVTPEAARAVREMGFAMPAHASKPLTRKLIAEADVVYAMTASHRRAILEIDPGSADKVFTLDPAGDVPDPIGQGQAEYTSTALRLRDLITKRLKEFGA